MARKAFIGGNWKCNGTKESVAKLVDTLNQGGQKPANTEVICAPTALHLDYVKSNLRADYQVCAQNIWSASGYGAYTGELTASMVKDFGINWTLVGHSERRYKVAAETNELLLAKTKAALDADMASTRLTFGDKKLE